MTMLDRLFGDPEKPLKPDASLVPDVDLTADDYDRPDEGDADGQEKANA